MKDIELICTFKVVLKRLRTVRNLTSEDYSEFESALRVALRERLFKLKDIGLSQKERNYFRSKIKTK